MPCADYSTTRAEATEMTDSDRRRDERHRFNRRRLRRVAEGNVRRKSVEARLAPEFAHPSHITFACVLTEERRDIPARRFEWFRNLKQPLVHVHQLRRPLDRHPHRVAALPTSGDAQVDRLPIAHNEAIELREERVDRLGRDEMLR